MRKNKGFTLVELLVVIAIIGLLSTLAVVSLSNIREKGRDAKRLSDMDALKTVLELTNSEKGSYSVNLGCVAGAVINSCTSGNLEAYLPTVKNLNDPSGIVNCATDCAAACNYAFKTLTATDYSVYFYLEKGAADFNQAGCYQLTNKGISKI